MARVSARPGTWQNGWLGLRGALGRTTRRRLAAWDAYWVARAAARRWGVSAATPGSRGR